jgi:2-amino-4-hydroxy-6-hydroxymethyldihydropteridine diphosphokinase
MTPLHRQRNVAAAAVAAAKTAAKARSDAGMVAAYIGLGANLGNPVQAVRDAIAQLGQLPGTSLLRSSSLYASAPVDASGDDYINAVALIDTALSPLDLLKELQQIEQVFGRERPFRNAPRTLDLDLLLYGEQCIDEPGLHVPHPRMRGRAFVLLPLLELDPALVIPGQRTAEMCLAEVQDQPIRRLAGPVSDAKK